MTNRRRYFDETEMLYRSHRASTRNLLYKFNKLHCRMPLARASYGMPYLTPIHQVKQTRPERESLEGSETSSLFYSSPQVRVCSPPFLTLRSFTPARVETR